MARIARKLGKRIKPAVGRVIGPFTVTGILPSNWQGRCMVRVRCEKCRYSSVKRWTKVWRGDIGSCGCDSEKEFVKFYTDKSLSHSHAKCNEILFAHMKTSGTMPERDSQIAAKFSTPTYKMERYEVSFCRRLAIQRLTDSIPVKFHGVILTLANRGVSFVTIAERFKVMPTAILYLVRRLRFQVHEKAAKYHKLAAKAKHMFASTLADVRAGYRKLAGRDKWRQRQWPGELESSELHQSKAGKLTGKLAGIVSIPAEYLDKRTLWLRDQVLQLFQATTRNRQTRLASWKLQNREVIRSHSNIIPTGNTAAANFTYVAAPVMDFA